MEEYRNHILRDRWQEKARNERGEKSPAEIRREQDISLYIEIKTEAKTNEQLMKILEDVERRAVRYRNTINTATFARMDNRQGGMLSEVEESDTHRRLAHEALLTELNILSRQFKAEGLDNEWRRKIGLEREDVGRWGQSIAQLIYRKFEESHYDH